MVDLQTECPNPGPTTVRKKKAQGVRLESGPYMIGMIIAQHQQSVLKGLRARPGKSNAEHLHGFRALFKSILGLGRKVSGRIASGVCVFIRRPVSPGELLRCAIVVFTGKT